MARSTFRSQNVQSTPAPDHFWKLRCRKSARRCGAKHISKSKCTKRTMLGPLLEVEMSKSARRCRAKHISKSKVQKIRGTEHFWTFRCGFAWQAQGIVHLVKMSKMMAGVGHLTRICKDAFSVAGAVQERGTRDFFIRAVRRSRS